jgi:hypothetical protein
MKGVPGVAYTVFAHSAKFPDGSSVGRLTLSQVHGDKVPMAPPNGTSPAVVGTLQPPRAKFNPPIRIQVPNSSALAAGQVVEVYSFDHDLEQFVSGGTARVSEDASVIVSDPGFGLRVSGWHAAPPPPPPKTCVNGCDDKNDCTKDECVNGACKHTPVANGTACTDDKNECTKDVCQGGSCQHQPPEAPKACCEDKTTKKIYDTGQQCCTQKGVAGKTQSVRQTGFELADCPGRHGSPPGYVNSFNGCTGVPNDPTSVTSFGKCSGAAFTPACNQHDLCYGECNKDKGGCDRALGTDTATICRTAFAAGSNCLDKCLANSRRFEGVVSSIQHFYDSAQKDACLCCP